MPINCGTPVTGVDRRPARLPAAATRGRTAGAGMAARGSRAAMAAPGALAQPEALTARVARPAPAPVRTRVPARAGLVNRARAAGAAQEGAAQALTVAARAQALAAAARAPPPHRPGQLRPRPSHPIVGARVAAARTMVEDRGRRLQVQARRPMGVRRRRRARLRTGCVTFRHRPALLLQPTTDQRSAATGRAERS